MNLSEDIFVNDVNQTRFDESTNKSGGVKEHSMTDVRDLIPLCVTHATGPLLSAATFGYDIAQMEKRPWREPNAKQSDYFNYGFDETSWRLYCALQAEGEESLLTKAKTTMQRLQLATHQEFNVGGIPEEGDPSAADVMDGPYGVLTPTYDVQPSGDNVKIGYRTPFSSHSSGFNYKTKLCQRFAEGRCTKGSECTYAHGISELRAVAGPGTSLGASALSMPKGNSNPNHPLLSGVKAPSYLIPPYDTRCEIVSMPPPPPISSSAGEIPKLTPHD